METSEELNWIGRRMEDARKYKLVTEVVYYALQAMQSDPSISIAQAVEFGCAEWDV